MEITRGEGDLEDDWKFAFGEAYLDVVLLGFGEFDLDLERELFLDTARELLDEE